ncbi:redoxin domain-containing protein [bacterium]|nr:redoxin domain-containing protein [bacterium]
MTRTPLNIDGAPHPRLHADQPAPPFARPDLNGEIADNRRITAGGKPIALEILRYIGCPICRMRLHDLDDAREVFTRAGGELVVVIPSPAADIAAYLKSYPVSLCVVPDPEREVVRKYAVERVPWSRLLAPTFLGRLLRAHTRGHFHGKPGGDEFQAPSSFVIAPDGTLALVHYGRHIGDWLPIAEFAGALAAVAPSARAESGA